MRSIQLAFISILALIGSAANAEGSIKVLFIGYDNNVSGVKNDILGPVGMDARFDYLNSGFLVSPSTVSLATLMQYDSVLMWSNNLPSAAVGNTLADYADAGGGVVLATFAGQAENSAWGASRINSSGYNPMTGASNAYGPVTLGSFDAGHPIMAGVSSLSSGQYNSDYSALDSGADLVASWNNGDPLAATNSAGSVAFVTLFPNVYTYGHATGDYRLLFRNALAYTADPVVTATTPEPASCVIWGALGIAGLVAARRRKKVAA